jgi:glycosyltransferase involved in cell wall biosynthesis
VLSQDIDGIEYLIYDACSTDGTREILARYADSAHITIAPDAGQADAVNKGLRAASGEVIGWVNSDDVYYPGACARVLEVFAGDQTVDVVYGEADHIDEDDRVLEPYYTEPFDYEQLKDVCFFCQPATFFRRRIIDHFGLLRADLRYCMDYEYWLRICAAQPARYLCQKIAGSRLYSHTKTLGSRAAVHREILEMLSEKFGRPPAKWVYNLAHVVVEQAGYTRDTPEANLAFVTALVGESRSLFARYGGTPLKERLLMMRWLWAARRAA